MTKLILHDFFIPHQRECQLLKNTWRNELEKVLNYWKHVEKFIKDFKIRKFKYYVVIPDQFFGNDYIYWKIVKYIRSNFVFKQIPNYLTGNYVFAVKTVSNYGLLYESLNEEFKRSKEIVLHAVKSYPRLYHNLNEEFRQDRDVVILALKARKMFELPARFYNDKEVLKLYVKFRSIDSIIDKIPVELLDDREFALSLIKSSTLNVKLISARLQRDYSFFIESVRCNVFSFREFPLEMQDNRKIVKILVGMNLPLFLVSSKFCNDQEIVLKCLEKRLSDFKHLSDFSFIEKEFIISNIRTKPNKMPLNLLEYLPSVYQFDKEVIFQFQYMKKLTESRRRKLMH